MQERNHVWQKRTASQRRLSRLLSKSDFRECRTGLSCHHVIFTLRNSWWVIRPPSWQPQGRERMDRRSVVYTGAGPQSDLDEGPLRRIIRLAGRQHRIGDPGDLVGQRHGGHISVAAGFQPRRPATRRIVLALDPAQHGASTVDQQLPQVDIAAFADAQQPLPPACGMRGQLTKWKKLYVKRKGVRLKSET